MKTITTFVTSFLGLAGGSVAIAILCSGQGAVEVPFTHFSTKSMDRTVDPRKDYYRYAAGGWVDQTQIPSDQIMVGSTSPITQNIDVRVLKIVKDAANDPKRSGDRKLIGDFYLSSMDVKKLDEIRLRPIARDLEAIDKAKSPSDFARIAASQMLKTSAAPLIPIEVGPDKKSNIVNVLYVGASAGPWGLGLGRHEYIEDNAKGIRDGYVAYLAKLFEYSGDAPAAATQRAETVLAVEKELAAGTKAPVEMADANSTYNKMPFAEFRRMVPAIDVETYFRSLGLATPATVIVIDTKGIEAANRVYASQSPENLRSLFRARLLRHSSTMLDQRFYDLAIGYFSKKMGMQQAPPREKNVVPLIGEFYGHPISRLYVEKYFPATSRKPVQDIARLIKSELRKRMAANDWLSEKTRKVALAKLDRIQIYMGYPESTKDWISYSGVKTSPTDFIGNVHRVNEFSIKRNLKGLGRPVVADKFAIPNGSTPISLNAGLYQQYLMIEVTAAILQPPFFDPKQDMAANFGAMGSVLGHELTHGFDSKGRQYDDHGNMRDWWTPEDSAEFQKRADILVKQYDGYETVPGVNVNGRLTLAENIADLGGVSVAYSALQTYMKENGRLPDIDGLSPEQRFFLAWAQVWMTKVRPEYAKILATQDTHSPSNVRSFGPAVHLQEFFDAFGIKPGDPMWRKPEDRTRIW